MSRPTGYPVGLVWDRFYEISQVPRPSKHEEKIREYLITFAQERNLKYTVDQIGNVIIYLPATKGMEDRGSIIIQNHMDMVTDATVDRNIDFSKDPIVLEIDNGWVTADRTTLGADNGIGCAMALALCDEEKGDHPPLELLFTVDEETGLNGAINLDASKLSARRMINLDTEEWGAIYIGCAGGTDYKMRSAIRMVVPNKDMQCYRIEVSGLKGGHSGIDIHRSRGNALLILAQLLNKLDFPFALASFNGGKAHNIIPRDAHLEFFCHQDHYSRLEQIRQQLVEELLTYLPIEDRALKITLSDAAADQVFTSEWQERFMAFMTLFPHGAYSYNWDVEPPCANVSSNLAIVKAEAGHFYMETSCRFFEQNELQPVRDKIELLAKMLEVDLEIGCGYPSWKPAKHSKMVDLAKDKLEQMFGFKPEVKAIHAGLECGLLKDKLGELDIVSLGPNITGAHSPSERLEIETTDKLYLFLKEYLAIL